MKSAVFYFFYNWGTQIKESWSIMLALVLIYLGIEMAVKHESYAALFSDHGLATTIYAIIVVLGIFYIGLLLIATLILTLLRTAVRGRIK
jgi:hypothetical protein